MTGHTSSKQKTYDGSKGNTSSIPINTNQTILSNNNNVNNMQEVPYFSNINIYANNIKGSEITLKQYIYNKAHQINNKNTTTSENKKMIIVNNFLFVFLFI